MIAFVGLIFVVIGLLHFYLWKRLVKDPFRPGRARKVGAVVAACVLLVVAGAGLAGLIASPVLTPPVSVPGNVPVPPNCAIIASNCFAISGFSSSAPTANMRKPGVQKPHCRP